MSLPALWIAPVTCPAQPQAAGITNVVLGLLLPPEEAEAVSLRAGVMLAVEHANQVPAPKISLVVRGRIGQWGADAVEAAGMVLDDGAQGLIAPPNGAATHLALQVAGRTAVPVVSLCADSSVSRTGVPWMVRIAPTTVEEAGTLLAGLKTPASGPQRWAALVPEDRAGREVSRDLRQAASGAHCLLQNVAEVGAALANFGSVVARILKDQPQGVLVWLDPVPAGRLTQGLRDAGYAGRMAGPSRCQSPAFFRSSGQASEGFVVPTIVLDEAGEARRLTFQKAFRQRYGLEADLTAAESYDAALLLVHILEHNAPPSLPRAFPLAFSLPGVSGELGFDVAGNRKVSLRLLGAHGGRFVSLEAER